MINATSFIRSVLENKKDERKWKKLLNLSCPFNESDERVEDMKEMYNDDRIDKFAKSSPWVEYVNKLDILFEYDNDITKIYFNEKECHVRLYCKNKEKADALFNLLPATKNFGGQILKISVIPPNNEYNINKLFHTVFDGNDAISEIVDKEEFGAEKTYILFKPEIVRYFNDDISELYRCRAALYQDIAKEVFEDIDHLGVSFNTDLKDPDNDMNHIKEDTMRDDIW